MVGKVLDYAGIECQYVRGSRKADVVMRRDPQPTQVQEIDGRLIEWEPIHFKIGTSDLPFGQPEDNDLIKCVVNGENLTHGVYIPEDAKVSRDLSSSMTRVHSKLIQKT